MRIAIVGGGLGGLAAALFLRKSGLDATVYEQASEQRERDAELARGDPLRSSAWLYGHGFDSAQ